MGFLIKKVLYGNEKTYIYVKEDRFYKILGDIYGENSFSLEELNKDKITEISPFSPHNIIGVGTNYESMVKCNTKRPKEPIIFLKPITTAAFHGDKIPYPKLSSHVRVEVELGVIIGKTCAKVKIEEAEDYVLGYTVALDLTAADKIDTSSIWNISKMFDGFTPMGPYIVKDIDTSNLQISLKINNRIVEDSSTSGMIFNIPYLISYVSNIMTLMPGDIILTGTPENSIEIQKGDYLEAEIEEMGKLITKVV